MALRELLERADECLRTTGSQLDGYYTDEAELVAILEEIGLSPHKRAEQIRVVKAGGKLEVFGIRVGYVEVVPGTDARHYFSMDFSQVHVDWDEVEARDMSELFRKGRPIL